MASALNNQPWLWVLETIKHHEKAERFQQFILDMMWERGNIELTYIKNLQKWADDFSRACKDPDVQYPASVVNAVLQPAREAKSQAKQHQLLYQSLVGDDGPCVKLRTAITDIENTVMTSSSQRVFSTLVSQFISLHNQRKEQENDVNKRKQHFAHAKYAAMGVEGKINTTRNDHPSRPLSARKMENLEAKQFHLKKFAEIQEGQLKEAEQNLSSFMENQIKPLKSMQEDLGFFAKYRLVNTMQIIKNFMHRLQKHEGSSERKEKRRTLAECEKYIDNFMISKYAEESLEAMESKVKETVSKQANKTFTLENFMNTGRKVSTEISNRDMLTPAGSSEQDRDRPLLPRQNKKLHPVQISGRAAQTESAICSNIVALNRADERNATGEVGPRLKSNNNKTFVIDTSNTEVRDFIETLVLPNETETLSKEKLPWSVKDFCAGSDEEVDTSPFLPEQSRHHIKKRIVFELYDSQTEVIDIVNTNTLDENRQSVPCDSPLVSSDGETDSSSPSNEFVMGNTNVISLHDYTATNTNELSLSKGNGDNGNPASPSVWASIPNTCLR